MDNQTNPNLKSKTTWEKFLYLLLFAICFNVAEIVLWAITIIQFVSSLLRGEPLQQLQVFGSSLATYLSQVANFLTFASDKKPFPLNPWPMETKQDIEDVIIITPAPDKSTTAPAEQNEIKKVAAKKKAAPKKKATTKKKSETEKDTEN
ncbi:MAG: DUF4389 domain-containing protein [Sneathiella sp.]